MLGNIPKFIKPEEYQMTEENVFKKMEAEGASTEVEQQQPVVSNNEIDYEKLSNIAVGDKVKFERISLDGKIVKISKAQLFNADTNEEPITAMNDKTKKYYKCNFIIHYENEVIPEDKPQREYISGVIQFLQKDGSLSAHNFWYEDSGTQTAALWELVAKKKGIEPKELNPREFIGYLNSGVSVKLSYADVIYNKKIYHKNLPVEII